MQITTYNLSIELLEDLLGTCPSQKNIYSDFVASKAPKLEDAEEEIASLEEIEAKGHTTFLKDEKGNPVLMDYAFKGFLKESGRTLKQFGLVKQLQDKISRYVFVMPRRITLPPISGVFERPLRALTARGPRVCLAKSDVISAGGKINLQLKVLEGAGITKNLLAEVLAYGELQGLGCFRGGSYGRFSVLDFEEV